MTSIGTFAPGTGGILDVTVPPGAPQDDWVYTVPDRVRLRLVCGRCSLTTSAVAGTRRVQLEVLHPPNTIASSSNQFPHAPSTVSAYMLTPGADIGLFVAGTDIFLTFPPGLILPAADQLRVYTTGIQPGDQWSSIYLRFEQWIEA